MPFSPKRIGSFAYSMVMFVVVSVLAGVLVAGLFVPVAGIAGVSGRAAAAELKNLPEELATPPQPERSKILLGDGSVLAYIYDQNRVYTPLNKIAPVMRQAQLAIEDHRFYEHGALDFKATLRAFLRNSASTNGTQGGSTITQQYVKMVQVEKARQEGDQEAIQAAQETSYSRKIQELRYAIALENKLTKDEILERYLNIAYYGDGAYGVEAAAKHYFNVSSAELNLPQAAMLAGLVQNPDSNNPVRNVEVAIDRRDVVVNRMAELKLINAAQLKDAKAVKFDEGKVKATRNGCVGTTFPFLCDYVKRTLLQSASLGKTVEERQNLLERGGLTIETKIDQKSQQAAQKAVSDFVDPRDPIVSVMTMVEPGTGLILGMAQSRPVMGTNRKEGETYYNYAVTKELGGAEGYQAGSTFKAFTAAAALEKGIPLTKKYNAQSGMEFGGKTFRSCDGPFKLPGSYKVGNSTGTNGVMDMYTGTARSVNTYFLQLEQTTGLCEVTKMAKKLGVQESDTERDIVDYYQTIPSFTLGVANVTPLSMAEAYATFAARGIHCNPIVVEKITTQGGKELPAPAADCKRVIPEDVADGMNRLLSRVMTGNGTGTRARIPGVDGSNEQAGKTGTTNSNRAVWFTGYTPEVAGAAMIAVDNTQAPFKGKPNKGFKGYTMPYSGSYLEGTGSGDAGLKIWAPAMEAALKGKPHTNFKAPPKTILEGRRVEMPSLAGLSRSEATAKLEKEGFTVTQSERYSGFPVGTFLGFSPSSGSVKEFSTIYVVVSAGEDPAIARERQRKAAEAQQQAADAAAKKKAEETAAAKAREEARKAAEQKKKDEQKKNGGG